jgi:predicted metal-dependent hydrolase
MKKRTIALEGKRLPYTFRRSARAKRVRLSVLGDGSVVLTAPAQLPEQMARRFLMQKKLWLLEKIAYFKTYGSTLPRGKRAFRTYRDKAEALVAERLAYFNGMYGYKYARVSVRDQTSRWGSCSKRGNLSFNYRLALLPPKLADYVIVHELCHLAEFNHSKKFWALVSKTMPQYSEYKRSLRRLRL